MPTLAGFGSLRTIKKEKIGPKITRKLVSGERGMIVWWSVKKGAHAAAHKHPHEQIFWILKGKMKFRLGDKTRLCKAGDIAVIPGGVGQTEQADREQTALTVGPRKLFVALTLR